jgi:predicted nucleic acid-binding protein
MKVIIDSSPIISLAVIDQLELVEKLFPEIIVPHAVYLEVKAAKDKAESDKILNFIRNRVYFPKEEKELHPGLGKGKIEAISLCLELNADLLVIDEKKARKEAKSHNIRSIGTLGILTLAKRKGLIRELRTYFIQLIEKRRYFSLKLMNEVLELNQEEPLSSEY